MLCVAFGLAIFMQSSYATAHHTGNNVLDRPGYKMVTNIYGTPCYVPVDVWGEALDLLDDVVLETVTDDGVQQEVLICSDLNGGPS